jgi:hypothetical protein
MSGSSFTVTPAVLTVTPASQTVTYGGAIPAPSYSIDGLVNGDTASGAVHGAPTIASGVPAHPNAGNYTISLAKGTLSASNYTFKLATGTLAVQKAVLTLTASNLTTTYGSTVPNLGYSVAGFVAGDTAATAVSGAPALATKVTSRSQPGSYSIVARQGSLTAANYTFQLENGTAVVAKATLIVSVKSASMTYGTQVPAMTYTYTGFVNQDGPGALSGTPSATTSASATSPAGSYPVTLLPGTLASEYYNFNLTSGTLTVAKAPLKVIANNQSTQVGGSLPPLTYTTDGLVNGDTLSSATSGTPTLSTSATTSKAGSYPIQAGQGTLAASNYELEFSNGTLTVMQ